MITLGTTDMRNSHMDPLGFLAGATSPGRVQGLLDP